MIPKREESLDLTSPNAVSYAVFDLISHLRWTRHPNDFAAVTSILSAREEKMKIEYGLLEEGHAQVSLSLLQTEDELQACKMENAELREEMVRAKDEIKGVERDKRGAEELVKLYQARFDMLASRVLRLEDDARVLMSDRAAAQDEDVARGANAMSSTSLVRDQIGETQGQATEEIARVPNIKKKDDPSTTSKTDPRMPVKIEPKTEAVGNTQQVSETANINEEMALPSDGRNSTVPVVIIDSSDDEQEPIGVKTLVSGVKRKGVLPFGGVDEGSGSYSQISGGEIKPPQDLNVKHKKLRGSQFPSPTTPTTGNNVEASGTSSKQDYGGLRPCVEKSRPVAVISDKLLSKINRFASEDSSSDDSDNDIWHEKWQTESDMMKALEKDAQLCMKAICALYREKAFTESQNHEKSTALRGASLAEFLINGDPLARLNRSVADLCQKDEKGLQDCKRISKMHSKKLFEIYTKNKDNYRPPLF